MKSIALVLRILANPSRRRNLVALAKLLLIFVIMVSVFTMLFHWIMEMEGQKHSWVTGVYWVLVVMSTLGFGDITFQSDIGRLFSVVVLLSGSVFMLILLPFMFIQFFYVPWLDAQAAALRLYDEGFSVMLGDIDDPATYHRARAESAALVVAAQKDTTNTNIAFTVREISASVSIVAVASFQASVDILELAGCNQVLQLGEMLGQSFARRVFGRDAKSLVIGEFGDLLIAEASAAGTPMVGHTLSECRFRQKTGCNVVAIEKDGVFDAKPSPSTILTSDCQLVIVGDSEAGQKLFETLNIKQG